MQRAHCDRGGLFFFGGSSYRARKRTCSILSLKVDARTWAVGWRLAAFYLLRADEWLVPSFFSIIWDRLTFHPVGGSMFGRIRISASPRSPICSMGRSIIATVLASANRFPPVR